MGVIRGLNKVANGVCLIEGCERPPECRGWCGAHYSRWKRSGVPVFPVMRREDYFWAKVEQQDDTCWQWKGASQKKGYGNFWEGKAVLLAHRYAYLLLVGPIPEDRELDHLCRNRGCVNPLHLEPVTHEENIRRAWAADVA